MAEKYEKWFKSYRRQSIVREDEKDMKTQEDELDIVCVY